MICDAQEMVANQDTYGTVSSVHHSGTLKYCTTRRSPETADVLPQKAPWEPSKHNFILIDSIRPER